MNHHLFLRAIGGSIDKNHSNKTTEYWTIPESSEGKFYDGRQSIPFRNLLCGFRKAGFIVYLDIPEIIASGDLITNTERKGSKMYATYHYIVSFDNTIIGIYGEMIREVAFDRAAKHRAGGVACEVFTRTGKRQAIGDSFK